MGARAELQKEIVVTGNNSAATVYRSQDVKDWLPVGNWADAIFTVKVTDVTVTGSDTVNLSIQTCDEKRPVDPAGVPTGPMWNVKSWSSLAVGYYKYATRLSEDAVTTSDGPMDAWLMWNLEVTKVTGGDFSITFEIDVTLKTPA